MRTNILGKAIFFTLLGITFSFLSLAQTKVEADTTKIPFVAYWEKGDSYDFVVTKIQRQWKEGKSVKNDSVSYRANFTVLDSTETSYKIKWTYETNLSELKIPAELFPKLSKYKTTEIIYWTDETGAFEEVENWRDIANMMNSLFNDAIQYIKNNSSINEKSEEEGFQNLITSLKNVFNSREGVERVFCKELQVFHFPLGVEFSPSEPIIYQEELPNMLGGDPIKANATLRVESVDEEEGFCVLVQEMKIDADDTKRMLSDFFKKIGVDKSTIDDTIKISVFDITDNNRYEYFYYPGIPYKIETARSTTMNINNENGKKLDILRIELAE